MKRNNDIEKLLAALMVLNILPYTVVRGAELSVPPRLVVEITIDQLRSDYLEYYSPFYKPDGWKKLWQEGKIYENASYPFTPVDRASAVACIATGTTPQYNHILSDHWFDRSTLQPLYCVQDKQYSYSPAQIGTSSIGDELKVSTEGRALVYGVAWDKDAAILSAGHAADGAIWMDEETGKWATSSYYPQVGQQWVKTYNAVMPFPGELTNNEKVARAAVQCVTLNVLGRDQITDYLSVTLSAKLGAAMGTRTEMESVYRSLDETIEYLINSVESKVGRENVMFVVTATGNSDEPEVDYSKYHIPTGTFYIDRTAQLLNMYLSAVYGIGRWVEGYYRNQIFLSHKLIEDKKVSYQELILRAKEMVMWTTGVARVENTPYDTETQGDLQIEVKPGWKIINEDTQETYRTSKALVPFPLIVYGKNIKHEVVTSPVTMDQIAPAICKSIQIRAPNGCSSAALP